jgi:acyl transferase domain-containing protein
VHPYRDTTVSATREEAVASLTAPAAAAPAQATGDRPVVFMFPGVTTVTGGTGRELYERYPVFRREIDACAALVSRRFGVDLRGLVLGAEAPPAEPRPAVSACATFAVEYALARLLLSVGLTPRAYVGHSMGEYVAASLAGVFRRDHALELVATRYELLDRLPAGAMLSVPLPAEELDGWLGGELAVTALNGPTSTVVSGPVEAVQELTEKLAAVQVYCTRLSVPIATHSPMLDAVLDEFAARVAEVPLGAPDQPLVSCVTGTWADAEEIRRPDYWVRQFRDTVRFAEALAVLAGAGDPTFLEVGPGPHALTTLIRAQDSPRQMTALPVLPHPWRPGSAVAALLDTLGQLWRGGVPIRWAGLTPGERRQRVRLPTYPFERRNYWLAAGPVTAGHPRSGAPEAGPAQPVTAAATEATAARATPTTYEPPRNEIEAEIVSIWQEVLGVAPLGIRDDFFALGGHSLLGTQIVARLRLAFDVDVPLRELYEAPTVAEMAERVVQIRAATGGDEDLQALLDELEQMSEVDGGSTEAPETDRKDAN